MTIEQPTFSMSLENREIQPIDPDAIPTELRLYQQWVCWQYVERAVGKKWAKQPINPQTLHRAGVQWSNTWSDFDKAWQTYLAKQTQGIHGIGFVLTRNDPYVAVDIDGCIQDEMMDVYTMEVVNQLASYTERSPSGQGVHILLSCPTFQDNSRTHTIELYAHSRYVTMTGHHVAGTPLTIIPTELDIVTSLIPREATISPISQPDKNNLRLQSLGETELWERIFTHDRYGPQHLQRFQGDTSLERGDHSFTVIRLLNCLARWTHCDAGRMRTMMLMSPLANEKWFEK